MSQLPRRLAHTLWAVALINALPGMPDALAQTATHATASRILRGGTFRFNVADPGAACGTLTHLKLLVRPSSGKPPYHIAAVNGVMRGTLPPPYLRYTNLVAGAATLAPSNDIAQGDALVLQIGLTGTSYGVKYFEINGVPTPLPQLWSHLFSIELNAAGTAGTLHVIKTESGPLTGGFSIPATEHHLVTPVTPLACRDF
jgi:hypothetical protein